MLQTAFTERAIKEHMDMKRTLERQSESLEHPKGTRNTRALEALAALHLAGSEIAHSLLSNWLENPSVVLLETESD